MPNECKEEINNYIDDINKLCETRLQSTLRNRTKDWEMSDLKEALKELKKNKSTDPLGYINELFTLEVAGEDLLLALLKLINKIKTSQYLPSMLSKVNISSIYKSKERNNFDNYRGIFRLPIIRSIIDKLIYLIFKCGQNADRLQQWSEEVPRGK